jgi:hypothetical protein
MLLTLTLIALGTVTVGSVVVYQRGARRRMLTSGDGSTPALPPARDEPAKEATLETLGPGDVIVEGNDDWLIVGTLEYREEGDRWQLHRVLGDGRHRWFEVRERDGLVAAWFEPATDIPAFGQLYDGLTHRSLPFRLVRRGDARVSASGDAGDWPTGLVRYATYEGPGGMYLNVDEPEGGDRRALSGERIVAEGLMLMGGDGVVEDEPLLPDDADVA